jgi:hypothetical protein
MKKVIKLTEDDLTRIVKQVINESSNEEDVKGKKCESCGKGTYKETESMDDLRGTLHCSKCDKMVDRYKKYTPFKKKSNKLTESDLTRLVKKVIKEELEDNDTPKQRWDNLVKNVNSGFCRIGDREQNQIQIVCNDETYYYVQGYR